MELLVVDFGVSVELFLELWVFDIEVFFNRAVRQSDLVVLAWTVRGHHSPVRDSGEGASEDEEEYVCFETGVEEWDEAFEDVWHSQDKCYELRLEGM